MADKIGQGFWLLSKAELNQKVADETIDPNWIYSTPEGLVYEIGSGQYVHQGKVLPTVPVDIARVVYTNDKIGIYQKLHWTLYGTENNLTVLSTDYIAGEYSMDLLVHNEYHIEYKWTDITTGNLIPQVRAPQEIPSFSDTASGTIIGSSVEGQISSAGDGKGKVNGWDKINERLAFEEVSGAGSTIQQANIINPNLLINSDFRINQRGQTNYPFGGEKYCVDRWQYIGASTQGSIDVLDNGIRWNISGTGALYEAIVQKIEQDFSEYVGRNITASVNCQITGASVLGVRLNFYSDFFQTQISATYSQLNNGLNTFTTTIPTGTKYIKFSYRINSNSGSGTFTINWCKLELDSVATPYSPRPYAEELAMCQRYYQRYNTRNNSAIPLGGGRNSTAISINFMIPKMRVQPTFISSGTFKILNPPSTTGHTLTYNDYTDGNVRLFILTSGLTEGTLYCIATDVGGYYAFDAEIY